MIFYFARILKFSYKVIWMIPYDDKANESWSPLKNPNGPWWEYTSLIEWSKFWNPYLVIISSLSNSLRFYQFLCLRLNEFWWPTRDLWGQLQWHLPLMRQKLSLSAILRQISFHIELFPCQTYPKWATHNKKIPLLQSKENKFGCIWRHCT